MRRVAALAFISLAACSTHQVRLDEQAPATFASEPGGYEVARVTRVVDGDTIEVEILERVDGPGAGEAAIGPVHDVRLIGIDTPESVRPGTPIECFGREASAATTALLQGQEVRLVKDVEESDGYDRLLRYVYIGDEMANGRLVVNGYANAYTYPPNVRHSEFLVQLQREAREHGRGLWSPDTCNGNS
ncbi:MAG: thermonuclease family protein [Actinomycetota bacterium]